MYKLGILLFGQPRYYSIVKKYYDEAFSNCEIDYFIHTWNVNSVVGRNQIPSKREDNYDNLMGVLGDKLSQHVEPLTFKYNINTLKHRLQNIYNPSYIEVSDHQRHCKWISKLNDFQPRKVISYLGQYVTFSSSPKIKKLEKYIFNNEHVHQWRSFERVTKLLKQSEKEYDLMLCGRFDLIFEPKPDMVERLVDLIEKNKSEDDELIVCSISEESKDTSLSSMYDWLWFGTKKGMIRFGYNFTRNQINDPKLPDKNYRARWADQLKWNRVPVYTMPGSQWNETWGHATLIKPYCPDFDIDAIKNYSKYHSQNTRGVLNKVAHLEQYNPEIKY